MKFFCEACGFKFDSRNPNAKYCAECRDTRTHEYRDRVRADFITAYGGKCACCGETEPKFLSLDHIHGGGNKHRRETGRSGWRLWKLLRDLDYPQDEYQLLCYNCNMVKGMHGECPHETRRKEKAVLEGYSEIPS